MVQEQAGLAPVALYRALRHVAHRGYFSEGKSAEEVQVHQLGERRVQLAEFIERLTQVSEVFYLVRAD